MKLKFIKESIIINEKSSDTDVQPSEKAIKGFRLNILDYIKRELDWLEDYDKTKVEKKLVYCAELDETSTKSYFSKKLSINPLKDNGL